MKKKIQALIFLILFVALSGNLFQAEVIEREKNAEIEINEINILDGNSKIVVLVKDMNSGDRTFSLKITGIGFRFHEGENEIQVKSGERREIPFEMEIESSSDFILMTITLELDGNILDRKKIFGNDQILIEESAISEAGMPSEIMFDTFETQFGIFNPTEKRKEYKITVFGDKFRTSNYILSLDEGKKQIAEFPIHPTIVGNGILFISFSENETVMVSKSYMITIADPEESHLPIKKSESSLSLSKIKTIGLETVLIIVFLMLLYHEKRRKV